MTATHDGRIGESLRERIYRRAVARTLDEQLIAEAAADEALKAAEEQLHGFSNVDPIIIRLREELHRRA